ncbi:MAG: phosphoribosylformylglycinamidine cyclo-ligase [Candidatus Pelagibacterales bacterium]
MAKYTYSRSGVDINKGNKFIENIKKTIKSDKNKSSKASVIGGFAGHFKLKSFKNSPYLVAATDGVGTKLEIANDMNNHKTIGIDLVAMCVNDIVVTGAKPLFFLDYIATGKLDLKKSTDVIKGILRGCNQAGCELLGGETAEMPGFYSKGKYDIAGFSVGILEQKHVKKIKVKKSDVIIGIKSSGLHSNGYSLVRNIIKDKKISLKKYFDFDKKKSIGNYLLQPTLIYVNLILELYKKNLIKSCAHITGGGIIENLPRILDKKFQAQIDLDKWDLGNLYKWLISCGINQSELLKTFNAGYGMALISDKKNIKKIKSIIKKHDFSSSLLGTINIKKNIKEKSVLFRGKLNQ